MNRILCFLFLFFSLQVLAQKLPETGLNRVRIIENDKTIIADMNPVNKKFQLVSTLYYYWYSANMVHSTQGGFSGNLLNGNYSEYYLNKNLEEQGSFKKGLKDGIWRDWNEDGSLRQSINWKNGLIISKFPRPIWKRLNPFKRKPENNATDSVAKPNTKN